MRTVFGGESELSIPFRRKLNINQFRFGLCGYTFSSSFTEILIWDWTPLPAISMPIALILIVTFYLGTTKWRNSNTEPWSKSNINTNVKISSVQCILLITLLHPEPIQIQNVDAQNNLMQSSIVLSYVFSIRTVAVQQTVILVKMHLMC